MQPRTLVWIFLAMALGIVFSLVVATLLETAPPTAAAPEMTRIYAALRDIDNGETIDERNVRLSRVQNPLRRRMRKRGDALNAAPETGEAGLEQ